MGDRKASGARAANSFTLAVFLLACGPSTCLSASAAVAYNKHLNMRPQGCAPPAGHRLVRSFT